MPPRSGPRPLTAQAVKIAMLDALGKTPTEISQFVGCHPKTVSNLKTNEQWIAERDKWIELSLRPLLEVAEQQRSRMLMVHDVFVDKVLSALNAQNPDGSPNFSVMLAAARIIHDHPTIKQMLGAQQQENSGSGPDQVTLVQFNIPRDLMPQRMLDIIDVDPVEAPLELESEGADE